MPNEQLNFERSRYALAFAAGTSDGTTAPQIIGGTIANNFFRNVNPLVTAGWYVEPGVASENGEATLDGLSRLWIGAFHTGSSGDWPLTIRVNRLANTTGAFEIDTFVRPGQLFDAVDVPTVIDAAWPADFMKSGGLNEDDIMFVEFEVTPTTIGAQGVCVMVLALPSLRGASRSNRGEIFRRVL